MVSTRFPLRAKQFEHQRSSTNPPLLDLILQSLNVNNESLWNNIYYYTNIDGGIPVFSGFLTRNSISDLISSASHIERVIVRELWQEIRFIPISILLNRGAGRDMRLWGWAPTENKIFILTMKQLITELMRKADVPIHCDIQPWELHQYPGSEREDWPIVFGVWSWQMMVWMVPMFTPCNGGGRRVIRENGNDTIWLDCTAIQLIGWNIYYSQGVRSDVWYVVSKRGITVGLTASVGLE